MTQRKIDQQHIAAVLPKISRDAICLIRLGRAG